MFNFHISLFSFCKSAVCLLLFLSLIACDDRTFSPENVKKAATTLEQLTQSTSVSHQNTKQSNKLVRGGYSDLVTTVQAIKNQEQTALLYDLYEGLTAYDPQGRVVPAVAESWQTQDNKNWLITLRKDSKWSNGELVTAEDFVKSWQQLALSDTPLKQYLLFLNLENAQAVIDHKLPANKLGVNAQNEYVLQIQLTKEVPYLPAMLAHVALLPQYQQDSSGNVANGAYYVVKSLPNQIQLTVNPHYRHADKIYFRELEYQKLATEQNLNDIDLLAQPKQITPNTIYLPSLCNYFYEFNFNHTMLQKRAVRKALVSMISAHNLVHQQTENMIIGSRFLPQSMLLNYNMAWEPVVVEQLLQQANITDKKPLKIKLSFENNGFHPEIARTLIQNWSQSDLIKVKAEALSSSQLSKKRADGDFQVVRSGWCGDYNEPSAFLNRFYSKSPDNKSGYRNEKVDKLLENTLEPISEQERTALYGKIFMLLQQDYAVLPIFQYSVPFYLNPTLLGVETNNPTQVIYSKDLSRRHN